MNDYSKLIEAMDAFRQLFVKKLLSVNEIAHSQLFLQGISKKAHNEYSYNDAFRLYGIIKPYASKLKIVGFDFDTVPVVALPTKKPDAPVQYTDKVVGYDGTKFIVRFPYNETLYKAILGIPGRFFEVEKKYWTVPISSTTELKQFALGFNFDIGDAAFAMMNNVHDNLEQSYSAEYIELGLPVKKDFYPFQTVGIDYGRKNRRIIIADQMGLGKTIQGIGCVLITESFPCIVVCPKSLRLNWKDEWEAWTNKKVIVLDKNNVKELKYLLENKLVDVVSSNTFR